MVREHEMIGMNAERNLDSLVIKTKLEIKSALVFWDVLGICISTRKLGIRLELVKTVLITFLNKLRK
ncbi:hypothetical protein D3C71_1844680 [compost metagenome]